VEIIAAVCGIVSVLTSWVIGGRLLALAQRHRRAPELLIGLGLFLTGGFWSPLVAVGRQATQLSDPARGALILAGAGCAIFGLTSLSLFNRRVFRPADAWAVGLPTALAVALVVLFLAQSFGPGWFVYARDEQGPWIFATWVAVVNYVWANYEAWRHYGMLARRQKLGLADPVVTDRMRLWALSMLAAGLACAVFGTCQVLGIPVGGTAFGLLLTTAAALSSAGFMWLAFMPPASYLAAVRQRAVVGV
jgi:hypothetical protein